MRFFDKPIKKVLAGVVLAIMVSVVGWMMWGGAGEIKESKEAPVARHQQLGKKVRKAKKISRRIQEPKIRSERVDVGRERPNMELEADIKNALSEIERQMLDLLQTGLDRDDAKMVRQVANMIQHPADGRHMDDLPLVMRQKVIEALGWFGSECLPELAGFLADADADTRQAAFDQFELALEDITLSDYDRAKIVIQAARVLTDDDMLDRMFMELISMRNSVGVSAIADVFKNGTPEALAKMPDTLELFTGEDNLKTIEDVEKWLEENPDGPDDDDLYGGLKD